MPAADVEVTNDGTGSTRRVTTSSAGVFNVPNLDLGSYRVRVSGKGFTTYERSGLIIAANQIINLDVQLTLGATTNYYGFYAVDALELTEALTLTLGLRICLGARPASWRRKMGGRKSDVL